jgi:aminoglycoside 2'-N-acetyltransferase I
MKPEPGEQIELLVNSTKELTHSTRDAIVAMCTRAFDRDFSSLFHFVTDSTHILAYQGGALIGHACWGVRWLQPEGHAPLRTAYVDAIATDPAFQGCGVGSAVIARLDAEIHSYDLGGLSTQGVAFYARLGWERWHGPTAMRAEDGLVPTPDDSVMILRTPTMPPLDTATLLIADYRGGQAW